jgi:NlpC/P60 family putative phage cell wall peptidase
MRRADIVAAARAWIGTPYVHQASVKGVGADCLGLVRGVWRDTMGPEPERPPAYSSLWRVSGGMEPLRDAARRHLTEVPAAQALAGDVVLFRMQEEGQARHAAILTGGDAMVHAYSGRGVLEQTVTPWWRRRIAHAFRFPGVED